MSDQQAHLDFQRMPFQCRETWWGCSTRWPAREPASQLAGERQSLLITPSATIEQQIKHSTSIKARAAEAKLWVHITTKR